MTTLAEDRREEFKKNIAELKLDKKQAGGDAATRIAGRRWSCGRLPRDGRPHVPSTCFSQASRRFRLRFIQRHFRCS